MDPTAALVRPEEEACGAAAAFADRTVIKPPPDLVPLCPRLPAGLSCRALAFSVNRLGTSLGQSAK
jgi:hypothetical protein